jgi:hypothetical protein
LELEAKKKADSDLTAFKDKYPVLRRLESALGGGAGESPSFDSGIRAALKLQRSVADANGENVL